MMRKIRVRVTVTVTVTVTFRIMIGKIGVRIARLPDVDCSASEFSFCIARIVFC